MGRPITTKRYPRHFMGILDRLKAEPGKTQSAWFKDKRIAKNFQLDFLAFKNAAINEKWDQPTDTGQDDPAFPGMGVPLLAEAWYPDLSRYKTRTRFEGELIWVDVYHIDYTPEAIAVCEQLGIDRGV